MYSSVNFNSPSVINKKIKFLYDYKNKLFSISTSCPRKKEVLRKRAILKKEVKESEISRFLNTWFCS